MKNLSLLFLLITPAFVNAEAPDFVKNLSGCFMVTYRFVENDTYELLLKDNPEESMLSESKNGTFTLQHFGIQEGQRFMHWREEWQKSEQKGQEVWTQKVFSPGGSLRYECTSPIVFNQWKCEAKGAAKPMRDVERTDYVKLDRTHTLQVSAKSWVQSENNTKIDSLGAPVSNELGWIEYKRVEDKNCKAAQ